MPSSSSEASVDHKIKVLLGATDDTPVAICLRRGSYTKQRRLEKLVRTPGDIDNLRWIDPKDSTNAEQELDDEQNSNPLRREQFTLC